MRFFYNELKVKTSSNMCIIDEFEVWSFVKIQRVKFNHVPACRKVLCLCLNSKTIFRDKLLKFQDENLSHECQEIFQKVWGLLRMLTFGRLYCVVRYLELKKKNKLLSWCMQVIYMYYCLHDSCCTQEHSRKYKNRTMKSRSRKETSEIMVLQG